MWSAYSLEKTGDSICTHEVTLLIAVSLILETWQKKKKKIFFFYNLLIKNAIW